MKTFQVVKVTIVRDWHEGDALVVAKLRDQQAAEYSVALIARNIQSGSGCESWIDAGEFPVLCVHHRYDGCWSAHVQRYPIAKGIEILHAAGVKRVERDTPLLEVES